MKHIKHKSIAIFYGMVLLLVANEVLAKDTELKVYQQAMMALEADFDQHSGEKFKSMIDMDAILKKGLRGLEIDKKFRQDFVKGMKTQGNEKLANRMLSLLPEQNGARLIDVRREDKTVYGYMRFDYGEQGYGFIRYELGQDDRNKPVLIKDWYDYSTGQLYSESLAQVVVLLSPDPTVMGRLFDMASGREEDMQEVVKLVKAVTQNDFATVKSTYVKLDSKLKQNWIMMLMLYNSANASGDMEFYKTVLQDIDSNFGKDPRATFVLLDYYFFVQRYDDALANLDTMSRTFQHRDAAVWYLKSSVNLEAGRYAEAIKTASKSIKLEPEFENSYWALLNANALMGKYTQATQILDELKNRFGYQFDQETLMGEEIYRNFAQSKEFLAWLKKNNPQ